MTMGTLTLEACFSGFFKNLSEIKQDSMLQTFICRFNVITFKRRQIIASEKFCCTEMSRSSTDRFARRARRQEQRRCRREGRREVRDCRPQATPASPCRAVCALNEPSSTASALQQHNRNGISVSAWQGS